MKVLNLYAGLGGNRAKWPDYVEVTAVEFQPDIAAHYQKRFPQDTVIVGDAHEYLLKHFKEFDFIWSSVPCPTHSRARFWAAMGENTAVDPVYPDMSLHQEIILLKHHFKGKWVVENVKPYYDNEDMPTPPSVTLGRHEFWCNFPIYPYQAKDADIQGGKRDEWQNQHGIDISGDKFIDCLTGKPIRKDKLLRNCVDSALGLHVFLSAQSENPETIDQLSLI